MQLTHKVLLFLDEPSCGMDVVSKRFMWSVVNELKGRHSIILTSHAMDEIEALCSRATILVNGEMRCLGPIQHLKTRYVATHMERARVTPFCVLVYVLTC
jgi:ABC-type multidrug transport system ATPase subunit